MADHVFGQCPLCGGHIARGDDWPKVEGRWLTVAGRTEALRPQAAALLTLLLRQYPSEVAQEELADHLWPETMWRPPTADQIIRTRTTRLRKLLAPAKLTIQSRNRHYRLMEVKP